MNTRKYTFIPTEIVVPHSTFIKSIAYQPVRITVTTISGQSYIYKVGSKRAFYRFVNAPSVGRHFNKVIKKYYERVD